MFVGDRPEDKQCADGANVPFLEAEVWRTGAHFQTLIDDQS
jgi:hypothetical protein